MGFKLGGRRNPVGESYQKYQQRVLLALMADALIQAGKTPTKAYLEVAKDRRVGKSTVQDAHARLVLRVRPARILDDFPG
jgi:hypothetical protein